MNLEETYTQPSQLKHMVLTGQPITESSPLTPQSANAETKIAAERFLMAQRDAPFTPLIYLIAMPSLSSNSLPT
jgi:nucleoside-diphosphate-sugar epimerase